MQKPDATTSHMGLLIDLTKRDFKIRYLGSLLGVSWNVIHPLVMILIYTLVFSNVMKVKLGHQGGVFSYGLYLCSGLLAWQAFLETLTRSLTVILDNAAFLKKVAFPPWILFGSSYLSSMINFCFGYVFFIAFSFYAGTMTPYAPVLGLAAVLLLGLFGLGLGMALGCLNVFIRDIQQVTNVVTQLWFWATPIVYLSTSLPEFAKPILEANPLYCYIDALHLLLYEGQLPSLRTWLIMLSLSVASLCLGVLIYRRSISEVRDEL